MTSYSDQSGTNVATRSDDPEVIRRSIDATRADLSRDVDALTEKVSPGRVVSRNVDKAKGRLGSVKDRVMGSSDDPYDDGALGSATGKASSMASAVGDTAAAAPTAVRQQAQGNPLAAGLIAFGVGWLASSLLPASEKERQAATALKDKASEHSDTLTAPLKEAAAGAKENLAAPAQEAAQAVKDRAAEAAGKVKDDATSAKDDVAGSARQASDEVRTSASS